MEDVLRGIDHVVADQFIRFPKIAHPVILTGIEDLREYIQEVDIQFSACFLGERNQIRHVYPRSH